MRLSDIMSATGLGSWAEVGLVISFITFAAIVVYVFVVRSKASYDAERNLPLDDGEGCQVRRSRRFAEGESKDPATGAGESSGSSDLAPPETSK